MSPTLQQSIPQAQSGRGIEEAGIRRQYESQIAAAEETARAAYQQELALKIAKVRSDYEAMIESEKAKHDLDFMISEATEGERTKFLKDLAGQKTKIEKGYEKKVVTTRKKFRRKLQAGIQEAKRIAARRAKTYAAVSPRLLRAYKKTEYEIFKEAVEVETEVFGEEVKGWEKRAVGEFETGLEKWKVEEVAKQKEALKTWEIGEKKTLETQIGAYKIEAAVGLETQISAWKKKEAAKFEPEIKKWREAWQPKSYAEQMLEWKAPDLPKIDIELYRVPVEGGYVRIGFDIGKFAEGLAEGSVTAAAGLVASGESLAYSIGGLAGVPTPRPPPTLVGGLIQAVPESIKAGELKTSSELEEISKKKYAFTYAAATLLGDLIISYGVGKVAEKGVSVIAKTRVGAAIGVKIAPVLKPVAKVQYKLTKLAAPVTKRMVKVAEWIVSPIYKAKAIRLAAKAPAAAVVPRGVLTDLTKVSDIADEITLASRMEARYGLITTVVPEEQVGIAVKPLEKYVGLTAAERWTSRAAVDLKEIFPAMKPVTQLRYGVSWGEPYFPIKAAEAPVTLAQTLAAKRWTVRALKWQLGAGVLPTTVAEDLGKLPKKFSEYVKPMKPPTPPREGIVTQVGRQVLIMEKPLVKVVPKLVPKVAPKVRISKWVLKAQKEMLKVTPVAKVAVKAAVVPAVKPAEATLAAIIGVKAVAPAVSLKQEIQQATKQQEKQLQKQKLKVALIPLQIPALAIALTPVQIPKLKQPQLEKAVQRMRQQQIQRQKQIRKEEKRLRRKRKKIPEPWKKRGALLEYPVRLEKEVPSFIFERLGKRARQKKPEGMNLSNAIFGKTGIKRKKRR